ncbi:NAD(P)/FAD-dependent oxidoreductase [Micromonospora sp. WMMD1155]|uniref:flavin-containing monooxygenase n=1 Tax=Micromonospora sp. WMMD1155 TaxID=3016094 RepID=UPI00249A224C|nr:NAD(P)/FAD-dependent oxidoreductase [Micromonospora sp. WMMD1155]WFE54944.1 NAD(P)/FAD-dependent oxidoreductase [Micromonospora sp. WMMD1155]
MLIVGAGLSGIGAACRLAIHRPGTSFAVLEARAAVGGTWDLFRYPGVRSDSDMFTLGYSFAPWQSTAAIADGASIRSYIETTAQRFGIHDRIRFGHRVVSAEWSSTDRRWTVHAELVATGAAVTFTCSFLFVNSGYYRYDQGFTPALPGVEQFEGQVVHPQHWPQDLDWSGRRVVVIGSGATAVTLVPALAAKAASVTMLQRSPTYVLAVPAQDAVARVLRKALPRRVRDPLLRWKNALMAQMLFQASRRVPGVVKSFIRRRQQRALPPGFDIDTHFTPAYEPWDQRLCFVPDADLFQALASGRAAIVTDTVRTFVPDGLLLTSGHLLETDLVVTATGLNLLPIGGIALTVDGTPVVLPQHVTYKGMMLSGVPNFVLTIGYTNASWTLKADLVAHYVCRLLDYMDEHGYRSVTPEPPADAGRTAPLIDLAAGYVLRSLAQLPVQGEHSPWRLHQNYPRDYRWLRHGPVTDEVRFER